MDPRQPFWSSMVAFSVALELGLGEEFATMASRSMFGEALVAIQADLIFNDYVYN